MTAYEPGLGRRLRFALLMVSLALVAGAFDAYNLWYVSVVIFVGICFIVLRTHRRWSGKSERRAR
jgi:membrane protein implicated in regulation of membrane protease activity